NILVATHKCEKTHLTNCNTTTYVKYAVGTSAQGAVPLLVLNGPQVLPGCIAPVDLAGTTGQGCSEGQRGHGSIASSLAENASGAGSPECG
ncbi:MAG: hypothetical protein ACP5O1_00620, partial [Phycisphaerae bacterium]